MLRLLAFDSSTDRLHLGVRVGAYEWSGEYAGGANASAVLIGRVMASLREAGVGLMDLDAIAFGRGPGAFTGLRTSSAVAQGLALGCSRPVVAVDSLMAVAEEARQLSGASDIWAAVDARMGEIYAAHYVHVDGAWHAKREPSLYSPQELGQAWDLRPPAAVAGNAVSAFEGLVRAATGVAIAEARPTARALLACAASRAGADASTDAAAALPRYVRDRVALTTKERAERGSAAPGPA